MAVSRVLLCDAKVANLISIVFLTPSTLVIAHDIALVVEIISKLTNWSHQKHPSLQLYSDTQADAVLAKLKEIRPNLSNSKILLYKLLVIWYGKIDEFQ